MTGSILVITTVHHPDDARIRYRQITTLLRFGWRVTYAAPFTGFGVDQEELRQRGIATIDLPRAVGRRRLRALIAVWRLLRAEAAHHDLILLHDPELLIADFAARAKNTVLDVHEDAAAAIEAKQWIPSTLRRPIFACVRWFERWAEGRMPLLLAEYQYQDRFRREHVVVPNAVTVPDTYLGPSEPRVVYLGAITMERGVRELVALARELRERRGADVVIDVIGEAHGTAHEAIRAAHEAGLVRWHGFVPSDRALSMLDGAIAGLSLLHDLPNYRHSMPTKVLEYMAHGVPVITTPLPVARQAVEGAAAGIVVPFGEADAARRAVEDLIDDPEAAARFARNGHRAAREKYDWDTLGEAFHLALANLLK